MVDFLDFDGTDLYFDSPVSVEVEQLISLASENYPEDIAELYLLRSYMLEPENLNVHVAMYRYYYYTHSYESALIVAERTLEVSGNMLGYMKSWKDLSLDYLGSGAQISIGLTRYYLLALKASAYLLMRIDRLHEAIERLEKVRELDLTDQFGVKDLLVIAKNKLSDLELEKFSSEKVSVLTHY